MEPWIFMDNVVGRMEPRLSLDIVGGHVISESKVRYECNSRHKVTPGLVKFYPYY